MDASTWNNFATIALAIGAVVSVIALVKKGRFDWKFGFFQGKKKRG